MRVVALGIGGAALIVGSRQIWLIAALSFLRLMGWQRPHGAGRIRLLFPASAVSGVCAESMQPGNVLGEIGGSWAIMRRSSDFSLQMARSGSTESRR